MAQVNKMAFALAQLQSILEVYKGLFHEKEDAEIIFLQFHEIGSALKNSLATTLIIGCAALFTDPSSDKKGKKENMSFYNLFEKYDEQLSEEAISLKNNIQMITQKMNIKEFRNKYVGHFDLEHKLGEQAMDTGITTQNLGELMQKGQQLLNLIIRDAQLRHASHSLAYYTPIPDSRSTKCFLDRLRRA